jgi:hypothetical protein
LLHLVDDKFLVAQILYLLDPSSATGFFIFLMVDWGKPAAKFGRFIRLTGRLVFFDKKNGLFSGQFF